jgi:hypothetical protein
VHHKHCAASFTLLEDDLAFLAAPQRQFIDKCCQLIGVQRSEQGHLREGACLDHAVAQPNPAINSRCPMEKSPSALSVKF